MDVPKIVINVDSSDEILTQNFLIWKINESFRNKYILTIIVGLANNSYKKTTDIKCWVNWNTKSTYDLKLQ